MKRFYTFFVICLTLSCWVNVVNAQIAHVPDPNLAEAIRGALDLAPGRPIYKRAMSGLKKLEAEEVNDLTGLEHATQLESLSINGNQIRDLRPLENLTNLTSLDLFGNGQFSDLRPLRNLTNLTSLSLFSFGSTQISDFSPLVDLTSLTFLSLFFADIDNKDLTSIAMLTKLTSLGLGGNKISDVSPLAKLTNLTWLSLFGNKISDVSPLAKLTNLTWLAVRNNPIQDLSPLTKLPKLRNVDVELPVSQVREEGLIPDPNLAAAVRDALGLGPGASIKKQAMQRLTELTAHSNDIRDLSGLEHATQLEVLRLGWNEIKDISSLTKLTRLKQLELQSNKITDMSPLANLRSLEVLHIGWNGVTDLSPLAGLIRLVSLNLEANQIREISVIGRLTRLESLNLHQNPISWGRGDLSPLRNLRQLKSLSIRVNQLSDISRHINLSQLESLNLRWSQDIDLRVLGRLSQLKSLNLWDNREIQDITPLSRLTQLESLELGSNKISDVRPLANMTQLKVLGLRGNNIRDVTPLARLVNLEVLRLRDNPIQDASPLASLANLREIDIEIPRAPRVSIRLEPGTSEAPVVGETLSYRALILNAQNVTGFRLTYSTPQALTSTKSVGFFEANHASKTKTFTASRLNTGQSIHNVAIFTLNATSEGTGKLRLKGTLTTTDGRVNIDIQFPITISPAQEAPPVSEGVIPDPNLAAAVRKALGLGANARITKEAMRKLTELKAPNSEIKDLTGLEHATNLTTLDLYGNKIRDVTPIAGLTQLESLYIQKNRIRDVSPLAGLVNLNTLYLKGNPIKDLSPLAKFTKLREVDIDIPRMSVPTTGTSLAVLKPSGLAPANFTIGPGEFALLVHENQKADTGSADYNTYRLGRTIARNSVNADFPNLAHFFRNGGRIELVSHASLNPLPPDTRESQFADVVISEIMWGLNGSARGKQYIELYNASGDTYTFIDGNLALRFSKGAEESLPAEIFPAPHNPNVELKVIDRVSNVDWKVPGKSGNISKNKSLISMYRTIDYATGNIPDGTLASSWEASNVRVNLPPPSYGTPGAKDLPPTPVVQVESPEHAPMYWVNTDNGTLHRLVGTEVENLIPSVRNATNLAIDAANEKLYWTEQMNNKNSRIRRANLDGTNVQLVRKLTSVVHGIALATVKGKIYLTNASGKVKRLNVDGSKFEPNLITGLDMPRGIALDIGNGKVYWAEATGRIRRADLDGSNIEDLPAGPGIPMNIAVSSSTIYWTVKTGEKRGEIRFANLTGKPNVSTYAEFNEGFPIGIAVDTLEDKLYWTTSRGKIGRGNIDESTFELDFVTGLNAPSALALNTEPPLVITPVAATTDAVIRISPSTVVSPAVGEQLTLNLNITAGETVAGYQFTLQFDPTALRYVESSNGDYLPTSAFFVQPVVKRGSVEIAATALTDDSNGDGTLATITFEILRIKASTLTLSDMLLANSQGNTFLPQAEAGEITEPEKIKGDVTGDGVVNIQDLVLVASSFGQTGENDADVNADGVVNITDLVLVAGTLGLGATAAAPLLYPAALEMFTTADVQQWLRQAQHLDLTDATSRRGILLLEQLLTALIPKETSLLANYPNPFNPETWIPYQLAKPAEVTLTIYSVNGEVVRILALGHQPAGMYHSKSRAAYWDGRNEVGELVASGTYFYTLTAGDFSATRRMLILK